jgi:hypothetical protein
MRSVCRVLENWSLSAGARICLSQHGVVLMYTVGVSRVTTNRTGMHIVRFYSRLFFLSDEGPRSRRYGRTAAMRLIVQPCDEDDDDDYYFLSFS